MAKDPESFRNHPPDGAGEGFSRPTAAGAPGAAEPAAGPGTVDWYALTERGDSGLRITSGMTLGEAPGGGLALNDPRPECRWVAFALETASGPWIELLRADCQLLAEDGSRRARYSLAPGVTLELPNNTLQMSRSMEGPVAPGPVLRLAPLGSLPDPDATRILDDPTGMSPMHGRAPGQTPRAGTESSAPGFRDPTDDDATVPADSEGALKARRGREARPGGGRPRNAEQAEAAPPPEQAGPPDGAADAPGSIPPDPEEPLQPAAPEIGQPPRARRERRRAGVDVMQAYAAVAAALAVVLTLVMVYMWMEWQQTTEVDEVAANPVTEAVAASIRPVVIPDTAYRVLRPRVRPAPAESAPAESRQAPSAAVGPGSAPQTEQTAPAPETAPVDPANTGSVRADETMDRSPPSPVASERPELPDEAAAGQADPQRPTESSLPRLETQQPASQPQPPTTSEVPVDRAPEAAAVTAPPPTARSSAESEMSESSVATRLARARSLLEAGSITFPPGANAVDVVSTILEAHPNHPAAVAMLGECAQQLLLDAERAQADGAYFEARNLLEELLSFDPDNRQAHDLWRLWVGSDR